MEAAAAAAAVAAVGAAAAVAAAPAQDTATAAEQFDSSRYALHSQGAEARVWEGQFLGRPAIIKQRFCKRYRHPTLDARLTPARLKAEVRSMLKARKLGVVTPVVYHVDHMLSCIYMERVEGHSVKTLLKSEPAPSPETTAALMKSIGEAVAHMHDGGLVHGDLTTSNLLVRSTRPAPDVSATAAAAQQQQQPAGQQAVGRQASGEQELVVIDFGLSYNSIIPEDKAVDLYVLERAFTAAHAEAGASLFEQVLTAYRRTSRLWSATLNRFAEVRTRGRKRSMVG